MSTVATILAIIATVAAAVFMVFFVISAPIGRRVPVGFGASGWTVVAIIAIWYLWGTWQ